MSQFLDSHAGAAVAPEAAFRQGNSKAAICHVMGGPKQTRGIRVQDKTLDAPLKVQVEIGSTVWSVHSERKALQFAASDAVTDGADQGDEVAVPGETRCAATLDVIEQSDHPDHGCRVDATRFALVVQADVSAHDRNTQRLARLGNAGDGIVKVPVHVWMLGIAEIEAIGDGEWRSTGGDDIACRLAHRDGGSALRISRRVPGFRVGRHRQPAPGSGPAYDRRVAPGEDDGAISDLMVVATENRFPAADIGAAEQTDERFVRR